MQVIEDRAAAQVIIDMGEQVRANRLEQRVARRDPFQCGISWDDRLVERDLTILAAKPAELAFLPVADGDEVARHLTDAVNVARWGGGLGLDAALGGRSNEDLRDN